MLLKLSQIRNKLNEALYRGTVECTISVKSNGVSKPVSINTALAKSYYQPIVELADELGIAKDNILSTLLKLPDVVSSTSEVITEEEWNSKSPAPPERSPKPKTEQDAALKVQE